MSLKEIAKGEGVAPKTIRQALYRLRQEFRKQLRDEVRQTLDDPAMVDEEIDCLYAALGGSTKP